MKPQRYETKGKKPYIKPELTQVKLVVGEAVLGFCKTATGAQQECGAEDCIISYRS